MLDALVRDLRHASRSLLARPTFALVSIVTLALVIGAASAVLAVVNATMIRPLPYPHADRLVQLFSMPPGVSGIDQRNPLHPRVFHRYREGGLTLVDAVEGVWARERTLAGDGEPESVSGASTSAGIFTMFGAGPLLGRSFTEGEARANARVAVISHALWQRRFGGDAGILGRTILIDREPFEVIGVMPAAFSAARIVADFWTPLNAVEAPLESGATFIQTFARLKPGVSLPQLHAETQALIQRIIPEAPKTLTGWSAEDVMLREAQFGRQRSNLLVLLASVLALTLIACANLANLTLTQALRRRSEMALRAALGASQRAVLRLPAIESVLLVTAGAVTGVVIGAWTLPALLALDPTTTRVLGDVDIDWRVQALTAALALVVALLSGLWPVRRAFRGDVAARLAEGSRRFTGSRLHDRLRHLLVAAQCAIVVVLLVCGALLLSAFDRTARTDPGFDPRGVLGAQIRISASAYPTEAARAALVARILERVRALPGVESAGTTLNLFQPGFAFVTLVAIAGKPTPDGQPHTVQFRRVSPDYFRTMRIRFVAGRDFSDQDGATAPLVAIVSRAFADRFWPGEDPIGQRIERGANPRVFTVIGVVEEVSDVGFTQPPAATFYLSYAQSNVAITPTSLVVRTSGDPRGLGKAVGAAVRSVDPQQPIDHIITLDQFLADSLGPQRFRTTLLLAFGVLGVALAAVGIYGVTARAVAERTRELGVRLALGATPGGVMRMVVTDALGAVVLGTAGGIVLSVLAATALIAVLPNVEQAETWTTVPAVAMLVMCACVAAFVPARRAVRVDPTVALRVE